MRTREFKTAAMETLAATEWPLSAEPQDYALNVAVVYEDYLTQMWAEEVCAQVTRLVGEPCLGRLSWRIGDLTHPRVLPEAVQAAVRADVIVVSLWARNDLPIDLCVWFDAWLPRRPQRMGAMVSLIGVPEKAEPHWPLAQDYLKAVARRGQLDYLPRERRLPSASDELQREMIADRANTHTQVLSRFLATQPADYRGWGINE
jgi:hypothetical protein